MRSRLHRNRATGLAALLASVPVTIGLAAVAGPALAVETGSGTRTITVAGTPVTESFDSLAATGTSATVPAGARFDETGTSANANGSYTAGTGSSNAGDVYSFGAVGATDRALGELRSGTLAPTLGYVYTNGTGATITSLSVAYTGEQWRLGAVNRSTHDRLDFAYQVGGTSVTSGTFTDANALDFVPPVTTGTLGALDGNAAADRTAESGTISGLSIPAGGTVAFRWSDVDATGADDGLGIDDLSVTASTAAAGGDQPISPSCGGALTTAQGTAASRGVGASDPDSRVTTASITSAAVGGITLDGVTPATATGGSLTATLNVAATTAAGTYQVTIGFGNDTAQSASCTVPVTVGSAAGLRIHDVQGSGQLSPYAGSGGAVGTQTVSVPGVVTGVSPIGYYLEDPTPDGDPLTSEGIFVFSGSAGARPAVGQSVQVSGKVQEFRSSGSPDDLSVTELTGSPTFAVLSTPLPALPAPVLVGPGGLQAPAQAVDAAHPEGTTPTNIETDGHTLSPDTNAADFYEVLEGMRVTLPGAVAVGPTATGFGELPVLPSTTAGDTGTGQTRTPRGGVLYSGYDHPNTRRVTVDDELYKTGSTPATPAVNVGALLAGPAGGSLTGVMTYSFSSPFLELSAAPTVVGNPLVRTVASAQGAGEFAIGSLNLENLDPTDPATKFSALAQEVVTALQSPDILNVQEVQDNNGAGGGGGVNATTTYNQFTDAVVAAGGPRYSVVQIDPVDGKDGGEPGGNIRQGLLYRTDLGLALRSGAPAGDSTTAVAVQAGSDGLPHLSLNPGRVQPTASPAWDASRKPLAVEFSRNGRSLFVVNNHFRSKGGDSPLFGRIQPATRVSEDQRVLQADIVGGFVKDVLAVDPNADVAVVGDLNDYAFSPTLARLTAGNGLKDLITTLPADEQYNYVFGGNSQVLDHTLVSQHLASTASPRLDVARQNSEFADQVSDHEPEVVRLSLAGSAAPALPEAPYAALLLGAGLIGVAAVVRRGRRA